MGCENLFGDDALAEILHAGFFDHAVDDGFGVFLLFLFPVVVVAGVHGGNEDVDLGVSGGGDGGVGDAGVADVNRHVLGDGFALEDLLEVTMVVIGEDDVMVGLLLINGVETEVEHEGGAGVLLLEEGLARLFFLAEDRASGVSVVSIDDELVTGEDFAIGEFDFGGAFTAVFDFLDLRLETDLAAFFFDHSAHAFGDFREAALGVVDAVPVFNVGKDAKKSGAFPWGHAEVFGLKGEGELETVVVEISAEDIHDGLGGGDVGEGFEEDWVEVGSEVQVGFLEAGEDGSELDGVVVHKAGEISDFIGE